LINNLLKASCTYFPLEKSGSFYHLAVDLKTHFRAGRHENKEKRRFYFGLRILLPIQIQLLEIEIQKL
jgi:hypothetical protein